MACLARRLTGLDRRTARKSRCLTTRLGRPTIRLAHLTVCVAGAARCLRRLDRRMDFQDAGLACLDVWIACLDTWLVLRRNLSGLPSYLLYLIRRFCDLARWLFDLDRHIGRPASAPQSTWLCVLVSLPRLPSNRFEVRPSGPVMGRSAEGLARLQAGPPVGTLLCTRRDSFWEIRSRGWPLWTQGCPAWIRL
jgi:hypothetical protein